MKLVFVKCGEKFSRGGYSPSFSKTPKIWNLTDFKLHLSQKPDKFENFYKDCLIYIIEIDLSKKESDLKEYKYDEFINLFIKN